jgi:hypothetical protein
MNEIFNKKTKKQKLSRNEIWIFYVQGRKTWLQCSIINVNKLLKQNKKKTNFISILSVICHDVRCMVETKINMLISMYYIIYICQHAWRFWMIKARENARSTCHSSVPQKIRKKKRRGRKQLLSLMDGW